MHMRVFLGIKMDLKVSDLKESFFYQKAACGMLIFLALFLSRSCNARPYQM